MNSKNLGRKYGDENIRKRQKIKENGVEITRNNNHAQSNFLSPTCTYI